MNNDNPTMDEQRCPVCHDPAGDKNGASVRLCMWCKCALIWRDNIGWCVHTAFIETVDKSERHHINGNGAY